MTSGKMELNAEYLLRSEYGGDQFQLQQAGTPAPGGD